MRSRKINESAMIDRFQVGSVLLAPLVVRDAQLDPPIRGDNGVDARLEAGISGQQETFCFVLESKSRSTPEMFRSAVAQVKSRTMADEWPMIQVPYLSPLQLDELEKAAVSGVDLCGNGVINIPGRLYIIRSGQPNQYPDSRPLSNPYRGRSAMVARMLLQRPQWRSLNELASAMEVAGETLSIAQVSKAVKALKEDLMVVKRDGAIELVDPLRLLDQLGKNWRKPQIKERLAFRILKGFDWVRSYNSERILRWSVTGESSVANYATFSQAGPLRLAVSSVALAKALLRGQAQEETIASLADIELLETDSPGIYFSSETDKDGIRWASRLQTWLELQNGDARQQDAARDLRTQILKEIPR